MRVEWLRVEWRDSSSGGAFVQVEWRLFKWSGVCSSGVAFASGVAFVRVEWLRVEWRDSSATNAGLTMNAPMQVFMLPGVSLSS